MKLLDINGLDHFMQLIKSALSGKSALEHEHDAADVTSGTLPVARGGTGLSASPSALVDLGSSGADDLLKASPRPGVTGTLPVAHGGTGSTTAADARSALGITPANVGAAPSKHAHAAGDITSGTLPVARGGTGISSNPSMLADLGSTAAASVFAASPRPGITGTLPVAHGGTGATTAAAARAALGAAAESHTHAASSITSGTLSADRLPVIPASKGGTGMTSLQQLIDRIYPVGSVYVAYNSTSPASRFGGTWTAITGRFPYFNAGTSTGGSNTHTLSIEQMPSHSHPLNVQKSVGTGKAGVMVTNTVENTSTPGFVIEAGGGEPHNNMPAYQTLYAWRRTA